jgi:orotate phosphoribosyltransferase-like protein
MSIPSDPSTPSTAGAPGRSPAQIRRDIALERQRLGTSVDALRVKVNELTDWRRQVREHQQELIVGAAIAGFALGGLLALRRRRRRR